MDAPPSLHPTDKTLSSYGLGKLNDGASEAVHKHLEECQECRKRVAEISSDSFLGRVRDAQKGEGISAFLPSETGGQGPKPVAPPPADTLPPGLADHPDYAIRRELGRGGMGVVYMADNTLLGRDEVLKVIGRQVIERPGVLERFLREMRAVAKLRHANIVSAYSAFRLGDSLVFAMEFVDGLDLSKLVKAKGPLPVAHACNFAYQAALGLQHAHEEGLVHRDIKPHNLMLARKGDKPVVKVLDFGLAKVVREEKVDRALTSEGQALGTPDYIAPEQILNAPDVDTRADIYSLGGTLYYLLSGHPPFKANSLYDIYQAQISRDADPLNLVRPEVPAELAALVAKMMAKEPARRFQTPGEVAEALKPFFKAANAAFKSPKADVSQAGESSSARTGAGEDSRPNPPAIDSGAPVVRPKKLEEPTAAEGRWESSIDIQEEHRESDQAQATDANQTPPRRIWPVALAASLFGLFILGVIIITIRDWNGRETGKIIVPDNSTVAVKGDRKESAGFVPLFNGKDLSGWKSLASHKAKWDFSDGTLTGSGDKGCLFNTVSSYENFHLRLEARINDGGKGAVYFRAPFGQTTLQGDPAIGYSAQINISHRNPNKTGSLCLRNKIVVGVTQSPPVELDQWFTLEIIANGPRVVVKINGKNTANFVDLEPGPRVGRIAFQVNDANSVVRYRNAEIKELPTRDLRLLYSHHGGGFEQVKGNVWLHRNGDYRGYFRDHARDNFEEGGHVWLDRKGVDGKISFMHITRGNGGWLNFLGSPRWTRIVMGNWTVVEGRAQPQRTAPRVEEWVPMLNGKDLSGWKATGNKDVSWTYEGKALQGRSGASSAGYLATDRDDYDNFHLRMETMLCEGAFGSVFFRCGPGNDGLIGNRSYAVRIGAANGGSPSTGTLLLSAGLDGVEPLLLADAAKIPLGPNQWFPLEIKADGYHLQVLVDGKTAAEFRDANQTYTLGRLGLVCHGHGAIRVRNLEVKELAMPTR